MFLPAYWTKRALPSARRARFGFSVLELLVVLSILLIVGALAVPNFLNIIANSRLRSGMGSLSGLLQDCRMTAVKKNRIMSTHFSVMAHGPVAFVKLATDASGITSSDPQVQLGAPVTKVTSPTGTGAPTALTSATLGFTPQTDDPSFNPRGLPCNWNGAACAGNVGFVYYFTDTRPLNKNGWAAVSVSPAGRVKTWFWNGSAWKD